MYAKLFASLYQGTLRGCADEILVFTNLLAHADSAGVVDKHWRAIAEECGISRERVESAIARLESPDPESRSPEEEGRRIVRLDEHRVWGWRIVNHGKYRAIRNEDDRRVQNREAQERWREKRKQNKPRKPVSAQAEAEAEAEAEAIKKDIGASAPCSSEDVEVAFAEFSRAATECGWPKPRGLEQDRRKKLKARLAEHGLDGWRKAISIARESEFLRNKFPLKFDWVLEPKNLRKVLEGNYGSSASVAASSPSNDEVLWEARFRNYHPGGMWQEATWGPRPESGRCHAPPPVLERWRGRVAQ